MEYFDLFLEPINHAILLGVVVLAVFVMMARDLSLVAFRYWWKRWPLIVGTYFMTLEFAMWLVYLILKIVT